ncbi:hypothetical protein HY501_01905 [Candidatus Woesearchaeota archaeon]|nr:hypothetical protein [Candidatus Woesearchaeota archaeon]
MTQTTIAIERETRDNLKELGQKGETYDEILAELIELARQHRFYERQLHILKNGRFVPLAKV